MKALKSHTGAKVLSLLFALVLWFNIATDQEYSYKVDIPIRYIDPPSGFLLASVPPTESQVYLTGSGKNLFRLAIHRMFNRDDSYVTVTLAGLLKGQHQISLVEQDVFIPMEEAIRVDNILSNNTFSVIIDRRENSSVPVSVDSLPAYELASGLVLHGNPRVTPEYVIVEGPEDIVRYIQSIHIGKLPKRNIGLSDTLLTASLVSPSPFVTINQETVNLRFPVERLRTKLFRGIPVTFSGFPTQFNGVFTPDTLSVMIQGPESVISTSRADDIIVEVDYRSYLSQRAAGDSLITPALRFPSGITGASTTPATLNIVQSSS